MKRIIALTSVLIVSGLTFCLFQSYKNDYATLLQNHPFNQSERLYQNSDEIPKKDRPDLAWEQNYIQTMDPVLLRPTPEKLAPARAQIKSYFNEKRSSRTGTTEYPWVERGPTNVGGRTRAIMWDPNDTNGRKFWAGGVTGGLWYTSNIYDADETWTNVDDFWANISITSIAYDPTNTQTLYVGTGEGWGAGASRGAGIWKSTDGGGSWNQLAASSNLYYVNDLTVRNENGSGILYVAVRGNSYQGQWHGVGEDGLFRSTDGGNSFTQVMPLESTSNSPYGVADIELDGDNNLWVGTQSNPYGHGGGQIWTSTDGTSWARSSQRTGNRVELATAPSNANVIYALIEEGGELGELIKTTDGGGSWSNLTEPNDADSGIPSTDFTRGQAWYDLIAQVSPVDENLIFVGGIDLFRSENGGASWEQVSHWYGGFGYPYVHADQHSMAFKSGSSSDVVFGNDGGVFVSTSANGTEMAFTSRNNNYNVTQFYAAAIHPTQATDYFLAGSQDNGTQKFTLPGLGSTTEPTGGDGAFCFIDQNDPGVQITSYVFNSYYLSTNGGASFSGFSADQTSGRFINPADYDDNQGILFSAGSSQAVARWTSIKNGAPTRNDLTVNLDEQASHLRVSPHTTNSTTLFVGTGAGSLYRITNAETDNPTQSDITGTNFPSGNISCLEIGESENDLICIFSNYGVTSIWNSSDGGSTWTDKEGNLPDMPVRWALYNPNNMDEVILATELGIWRTENFSDASPTWNPSNEGLANVRIDMLQIRSSDNEVIAATHGRGLYSSSGFGEAVAGPKANFSVSTSEVLVNGTVDFTDESSGTPVSWSWSFEGGTPASSTDQNPTITYSTVGTYDVSLTVTDDDGNSNTKTATNIIAVVSEVALPNIATYAPQGWSGEVTITNVIDEFETDNNISTDDEVLIAYAMANLGEAPVNSAFRAAILIDGVEAGTYNWGFNSSEPFNQGTYTYNYNINVGSLEEGEHVVSIVLDADDAIAESSEADNSIEKSFYVQRSCSGETTLTAASGTIDDGSGPSNYLNNLNCSWILEPTNAQSITLSFTEFDLENQYDFLNIYNEDNALVEKFTGSSKPNDLTVTGGLVKVEFVSDESQNKVGWTINYTSEASVPDLVISNLVVDQNETNLDYSFSVSNAGDQSTSQESSVAAYISDDDQLSTDDTELSAITIPTLGAGESETLTGSSSLNDITNGKYYLILVADPDNVIEEEFEDNNMIHEEFNVVKLADLVVSNISASESGGNIELALTVENQGIESVVETFEVTAYLSTDDKISSEDVILSSFTINNIDIDASENLTDQINRSELEDGEYSIIAIVDESNTIDEDNEDNNTALTTLSLSTILSVRHQPIVSIYPNPVVDHVTIEVDQNQLTKFQLIDLTGQRLQQGTISNGSKKINLSKYHSGVYLLQIDDGVNKQVIKLKKN